MQSGLWGREAQGTVDVKRKPPTLCGAGRKWHPWKVPGGVDAPAEFWRWTGGKEGLGISGEEYQRGLWGCAAVTKEPWKVSSRSPLCWGRSTGDLLQQWFRDPALPIWSGHNLYTWLLRSVQQEEREEETHGLLCAFAQKGERSLLLTHRWLGSHVTLTCRGICEMEGSEWGFAEHAGIPLPEVLQPQRMWFQPQSFKLCKKLDKTNPLRHPYWVFISWLQKRFMDRTRVQKVKGIWLQNTRINLLVDFQYIF